MGKHLLRGESALCTEIKWSIPTSVRRAPPNWVSIRSDESEWATKKGILHCLLRKESTLFSLSEDGWSNK